MKEFQSRLSGISAYIEAGNFFILISLLLLEIRLKYEIVFIRTIDKRSCAYGLLRYRNAYVESVQYRSRDKIRNRIVECR